MQAAVARRAESAPPLARDWADSLVLSLWGHRVTMAAHDPQHEFRFAPGAPTAGNFNAAAGSPVCTVDAMHYLNVASGGGLPAAPGAAARFQVPWTTVYVAMLKVHTISTALHGTPCGARITSLQSMHDAFQRATTGGLAFSDVGSLEAALAQFVSAARELAMRDAAAWTLGPAQLQALPAAPEGGASVPAECAWFMQLDFSMCSNATGSPLVLAALLSVLPGWCSHVSRAQPAFQDAAAELYDMVGDSRGAGWPATPVRRQALAVASHVGQRLQAIELILPVPSARAFSAASLYRLSRVDAFPVLFEGGWKSAYPSLLSLFSAACDGSEALRLAGRLLSAAPSPDPTASLDARVRLLLSHLDTAVLRG